MPGSDGHEQYTITGNCYILWLGFINRNKTSKGYGETTLMAFKAENKIADENRIWKSETTPNDQHVNILAIVPANIYPPCHLYCFAL
ncbi:MAG: hypothetical protein GY874_04305 [Desulfobacteraceae bacterium]|nr:hypothetical protein [Desulfobacteraceae bacterium]